MCFNESTYNLISHLNLIEKSARGLWREWWRRRAAREWMHQRRNGKWFSEWQKWMARYVRDTPMRFRDNNDSWTKRKRRRDDIESTINNCSPFARKWTNWLLSNFVPFFSVLIQRSSGSDSLGSAPCWVVSVATHAISHFSLGQLGTSVEKCQA